MADLSAKEAFQHINELLGFKAVAVALYRVMTSEDPVLVVKNEKRVAALSRLTDAVTEGIQARFLAPQEKKEADVTIITENEYKTNWKQYAGREVCMVEEEVTVENPGVDLMVNTLQHAQDPSVNLIDSLNRTIGRVTGAAQQVRFGMKRARKDGASLTSSDLDEILNQTLKREIERELVRHIIKLWGEKLKEKEKERLPFSDVWEIAGKEKIVKMFRGILARKHLVLLGHNPSLLKRIVTSLNPVLPEHVTVSVNIAEHPPEEQVSITILDRAMVEELPEWYDAALLLNFDEALQESFKEGILYKKISKALQLEKETSKIEMIKNEVLLLDSLVEDLINGRDELLVWFDRHSEKTVSPKRLKEKLYEEHSNEKVDYLYSVLKAEESELFNKTAYDLYKEQSKG